MRIMQNNGPLVSVIMPCYKESLSVLKEAIFSILEQTYKNIELIVIVDNPLANENIKFLQDLCVNDDNRIRIIVNEENIGIVRSLNKAIMLARGEYIARMDADDVSLPKRLESQLEYLLKNNLDIVGGFYRDISVDGDLLDIVKNPVKSKSVAKTLKCRNCVGHPTFFVKRDVYKTLNGYDDIPTCEDYHFLIKAIKAGYKIGNMPEVCLYYRVTPNSISRSNQGRQQVIAKLVRQFYDNPTMLTKEYVYNYLQNENTVKEIESINCFNKQIKEIKKGNVNKQSIKLLANRYFYQAVYHKIKRLVMGEDI